LALPVFFVGGCSIFFFRASSKYVPIAAAASSHLHEQMARGEDAQIYDNADPAFRAALSRDTSLKFFDRVRRKLGKCEYAKPTSWRANSATNGTFVTLAYRAQCSNGDANETLTWRIVDGTALLVGLAVHSPLLLTD
jgi:hypothetical protein